MCFIKLNCICKYFTLFKIIIFVESTRWITKCIKLLVKRSMRFLSKYLDKVNMLKPILLVTCKQKNYLHAKYYNNFS